MIRLARPIGIALVVSAFASTAATAAPRAVTPACAAIAKMTHDTAIRDKPAQLRRWGTLLKGLTSKIPTAIRADWTYVTTSLQGGNIKGMAADRKYMSGIGRIYAYDSRTC